ncbi:MAG TPA: hypothetical protein VI819_00920 [Patescibacteria group bacterium]|nr:hypothetical protein [Patescibacteria group bacterium]
MTNSFSKKGQSIFEVVIAIAIAAIVMTVIVSLSADSLSNSIYSKNKTLANRYTSETIEWLRWQRESMGWQSFSTQITASANWCFATLALSASYRHTCVITNAADAISGTSYFRNVSVSNTGGRLDVTINVSWRESDGWHETETSTSLVNI